MKTIFSKLIQKQLSLKQRQALSQKLKNRFEKSQTYFIEERLSEFEYIYCEVRPNTMLVMFEEEW